MRSGKSAFAVELAGRGGRTWAYVATAEALDDEMRARVVRHRAERGPDVPTIEAPLELASAVRDVDADAVVIDCLTLWLSNLLCQDVSIEDALVRVDELLGAVADSSADVIVVTNEVGMGVVPPSPLGRAFRDLTGFAHQRLSAAADEVYWAVMGQILRIKPSDLLVPRSA